jgi:hypothetical protein
MSRVSSRPAPGQEQGAPRSETELRAAYEAARERLERKDRPVTPSPRLETVDELDDLYATNRNPVDEKTPVARILASTHGQGPCLWLDLFTEIRCLAEGAQYACESGEAYSVRAEGFVFDAANLIATKAAALRALIQRECAAQQGEP